MKFLKRLWWLLTNRVLEVEAPPNVSPELAAKFEAKYREKVGMSEAWALVGPTWHYRFLKEMPCGCRRFPFKRKPKTMRLRCPEHGLDTWGRSAESQGDDA